jgi:cytoskeleton protein RodZ
MKLQQVADALHLSRSVIERLEADDYSALPPITFVRGYVRSYAVLLELDPDPLIHQLEQVESGPEPSLKGPPGLAAMHSRKPRPVSRGPGLIGIIVLLALLLAGVAAGTWWITRGASDADMANANANANASGSGSGSAEVSSSEVPVMAESEQTKTPEPSVTEPAESVESVDAAAIAEAPEVPEVAEPSVESEAVTESERTSALETPELSTGPDLPEATPTLDAALLASDLAADLEQLNFEFTGDSWMEVSDARGERLLFDMVSDGTQTLQGLPPFEIVVGNVKNVSLVYEGEAIDLRSYARGDVARLTLGDS